MSDRIYRILILQSAGKHDGSDGLTPNDYLRECFAIQRAFHALGHYAHTWGPGHAAKCGAELNLGDYDIIFVIDSYDLDWLPDMQFVTAIKLFWLIDLHWRGAEVYIPIVKHCDLILHSTRQLMDSFTAFVGVPGVWFPNAIDDYYIFDRGARRDLDVTFVGTRHKSRAGLIALLRRKCEMKCYTLVGSDMIQILSRSKIHFNKCISCDINYRIFETIGLGACLVTNHNNDIHALGFKDQENCLVYTTAEEAVDKVTWALGTGRWEAIRKAGVVLGERQTYRSRIAELVAYIERCGMK